MTRNRQRKLRRRARREALEKGQDQSCPPVPITPLESAAIIARHLVPLFGVFFLAWSPLEIIFSLFLDSLSVLARASAVAAYFSSQPFAPDDQDWADRANLIAVGITMFFIALGLFAFALGVFGFFIWGYLLRTADIGIWDLIGDRSLGYAFAAMLLCQCPGFVDFVRSHDDAGAQKIVRSEVGFILHRLAFITMLCGWVAVLPGQLALYTGIIIIQVVLAGAETMRRGR